MYQGYLCLGGQELGNNARAQGYAESADCPVSWFVGEADQGLADALGDDAYDVQEISSAPWFDPSDEATSRFYGAYIVGLGDISSSTREGSYTEGILDAGIPGRTRHAGKSFRVRAWLTANGEDALEAGQSWLDAALQAQTCGTHAGGSCGATDLTLFTAEPPPRGVVPDFSPWVSQAENLFTNPSLESTSGTVEVRRNLVTIPSFEDTSGTVEVRRNYCRVPTATDVWVITASGGGAITLSTVDDARFASGKARRAVQDTAGAGGYATTLSSWTSSNHPFAVGQTWTISMRYAVSGYTSTPTIGVGGDNPPARTVLGSGRVDHGDGTFTTWQTFTITALPTGGTDFILGSFGDRPAGSELRVGDALFEKSPILSPWFDGSHGSAGDITASWTGTAGGSESVLTGVGVGVPSSSNVANIASTAWSASRARSLRIIPLTASNDSFGSIGGDTGGMRLGMQAGKTYTLMATLRLTAPQTGTLNASARRLRPMVRQADGGYVGFVSDPAPNEPGVYPLRKTFTIPVGATEAFIRLMNGASAGGGEAWWDDVLLVEGEYTGPYFDGSTRPRLRRNRIVNPGPATSLGWGSGGIGSTHDFSSGHLVATSTYAGNSITVPRSQIVGVAGATPVTPGEPYYLRMEVKHSRGLPMEVRPWFMDSAGTYVVYHISPTASATSDWAAIETTGTVPANAALMGYQVIVKSNLGVESQVGDVYEARNITTDPGEYFDGSTELSPGFAAAWEGVANASPSYLYDPDLTPSWTAAADASESVLTAPKPANWTNSTSGGAVLYKSTEGGAVLDHRGSSYSVAVAVASGLAPIVPTVTYLIDVEAEEATTFASFVTFGETSKRVYTAHTLDAGERATFRVVAQNPGGTAGAVTLSIGYHAPAPANGVFARLRLHSALIVEGEYTGRLFDGSTESGNPAVRRYVWTGAEDSSTSRYETRDRIKRVRTDEEYEELVEPLVRHLHDVICISGPLVLETRQSSDGRHWGRLVEFTLYAGKPWFYGETKVLERNVMPAVVVQDAPFNLAIAPSAELAGAAVVAATNYSLNPSVEVDTAGWTTNIFSEAGTTPDVAPYASAGRVTGELSASGSASLRLRILGTATTGTNLANLHADQVVDISARPANARVSVSVWAALVNIGAATGTELQSLSVRLGWRNSAGTELGALLIDEVTSPSEMGGRVFSEKSMLPPAGTTSVAVSVRGYCRWSSGTNKSDIRMYVDALAVTVP